MRRPGRRPNPAEIFYRPRASEPHRGPQPFSPGASPLRNGSPGNGFQIRTDPSPGDGGVRGPCHVWRKGRCAARCLADVDLHSTRARWCLLHGPIDCQEPPCSPGGDCVRFSRAKFAGAGFRPEGFRAGASASGLPPQIGMIFPRATTCLRCLSAEQNVADGLRPCCGSELPGPGVIQARGMACGRLGWGDTWPKLPPTTSPVARKAAGRSPGRWPPTRGLAAGD